MIISSPPDNPHANSKLEEVDKAVASIDSRMIYMESKLTSWTQGRSLLIRRCILWRGLGRHNLVSEHGPEINTRTSGLNSCCRPFLQRYYKMSGRGRGRGRCGEIRGSTIEEVSSGGPACVIVVITPPVEQLVRHSSQESGNSSSQGPSHGNSQKGFRHKQKRQASQFRKLKSPK
ncbi:hypothetical protein F511_03551 [Dorcoceras hygrometricum]|uniref:Uncharacterized protein n=1 Tax=Dorcoceras hygrometricum TaxID=472368 RepID=A0A2Z7BX61_9LAMI|nr:hypothetical protein F511_03551 [Dorcoceras hygrometricum]